MLLQIWRMMWFMVDVKKKTMNLIELCKKPV